MGDYEALRQRHFADFMERLPGHIERLDWTRDQLAAERERRLRHLVRTAQEGSRWHADRLAGVDADALTLDQLSGLPVMTKDDLMENWDAIVTDPQVTLELVEAHLDTLEHDDYLLGRFHAAASGGSSGRRGVFAYDWDAWTEGYAGFVRGILRDRMTDPELAARPPINATVAADRATHMTSSMAQTFSSDFMTTYRFPITLPLAEIVAGLNEVQPVMLMGYSTALAMLAHEQAAGRLRIDPLRVSATSEPVLPEIRTLVEQTWNVTLGNWWGTSEAGPTGVSCGRGTGMHLCDDLTIIEPVDASGRLVPPGTRSAKIYLTNLYNPLLPLIRYEITDEVTVLDDPCPCGSMHTRIADIEGRSDDGFVYGDVAVHPIAFRSPLGRRRAIVEYQVRQTPQGADVDVRTCAELDAAAVAREIEDELRALGVAEPEVTVRVVPALGRQASGKLKRFIPLQSRSPV